MRGSEWADFLLTPRSSFSISDIMGKLKETVMELCNELKGQTQILERIELTLTMFSAYKDG